ncbi:hypothetical protein [Sinorhizobium meliloti]|uniref:hypothetical protein n=2 Tax=Rhizobium meliloti TaxID=382 RepID=UPI000680294A|nr:hypothetical protein [Sinorhizobium meliloti]
MKNSRGSNRSRMKLQWQVNGSIISVVHGDDETITELTDDGIDELRQMLADARRSPEAWNDFLDCFVDDEEVIARVKAKSPR